MARSTCRRAFPDYSCAPELIEAVARYMREGHNQYAPMPGVLALREALAMKIERLYGRRYDPVTEITVTTGATEGLFVALTAIVHPGDEVLLFQPAYDSYTPSILLSGGVPRYVTLRYPDYRIDWDEVRRKVSAARGPSSSTRRTTRPGWSGPPMTSPNCGGCSQDTDAIVISDEVYEHITFDGGRHESLARYPDIAERAIVISSFGKTYHTTGWKVGYCAAPPALTKEIQGVHQWVTFAVNGAVQMAYADMVNRDPAAADVTAFYQGRRDLFLSLIAGSRFKPLACRGTFFQLVDYSAITDERDIDFAKRLTREHGVAAIPISPFLNENEEPGPGGAVLFCEEGRNAAARRRAARARVDYCGAEADLQRSRR